MYFLSRDLKSGIFSFPAKDSLGIFRIGVAKSNSPFGPFIPEEEPIVGSYSIDPAIFKDDNEMYYMYFGGIWGGQLQRWRSGEYNGDQPESPTAFLPKDEEPALLPLIARMSDNLLEFDESKLLNNFKKLSIQKKKNFNMIWPR